MKVLRVLPLGADFVGLSPYPALTPRAMAASGQRHRALRIAVERHRSSSTRSFMFKQQGFKAVIAHGRPYDGGLKLAQELGIEDVRIGMSPGS